MHAAHRIYERLGFTRTPDRDWNPLPEPYDITLLTYVLTLRRSPRPREQRPPEPTMTQHVGVA